MNGNREPRESMLGRIPLGERRHYIVKSSRYIEPHEIHSTLSKFLSKDKFKVKEIRKTLRNYTRVSIDKEANPESALLALKLLKKIKLREVLIKRNTQLEDQLPKMPERIKLISVNINGIKNKRAELDLLLAKMRPDILCLQETKTPVKRNTFIGGYTVIETHAAEGQNGMITAIRNTSGIVIQRATTAKNHIAIKILTKRGQLEIINVYRHTQQNLKQETTEEVARRLRDNGSARIATIAVGDWNEIPPKMTKMLQRKGAPIAALSIGPEGSRMDHTGKITDRRIDYAIANASGVIKKQGRLRQWTLSDHIPIQVELEAESGPKNTQTIKKIDRKRLEIPKVAEGIKRLDFIPLENETIQEATTRFYTALDTTLQKKKVIIETKNAETRWPGEIKKACARKRKLTRLLQKGQVSLELHKAASREIKVKVQNHLNKRWTKHNEEGIEFLLKNDLQNCWKWLKACPTLNASAPKEARIYSPGSKRITKSDEESLEAWRKHFQSLSKATHHEIRIDTGKRSQRLEEITDKDLTWEEIRSALKKLRKSKAAGDDRIPVEIYKLAENEERPNSNLARGIEYILKRTFEEAHIPQEWRTSTIVPIHKKGDPHDPSNYRGISLINTLLKVTAKIITERIKEANEVANFIRKEQLGFMQGEECVSQAAALIEICQRREYRGESTTLAFLDLKKAYDMVPHARLFDKLELAGLGPRMVNFIRKMYESTYMRVRVRNNKSEEFKYERGVRQGCPTSPLLFNIYINDLLDNLEATPVEGLEEGIKGLLYADDTVIISRSTEETQRKMRIVEEWMENNSMELNTKKCGIMNIKEELQQQAKTAVYYKKEEIPTVSEYTYLGIQMNSETDIRRMAAHRIKAGKERLAMLEPSLRSTNLALQFKQLLIKSILIPTLHFGTEIFGMAQQRVSKLKRILDQGLAKILRTNRFCRARAYEEFDINSIYISSANARARGLKKWADSRGILQEMIKHTIKTKKHTWIKGAKVWLKRMKIDETLSPSETKIYLMKSLKERPSSRDISVIGTMCNKLEITSGRTIRRAELIDRKQAVGYRHLTALRCGTFAFTGALSYMMKVPSELLNSCVGCKSEKENLEHFIVDCTCYNQERNGSIQRLIDEHKSNSKTRVSDGSKARDRSDLLKHLLGGERQSSTRRKKLEGIMATARFLKAAVLRRAQAIAASSTM